MKHTIIKKEYIDSHNLQVTVILIPETKVEIQAIGKNANLEASDSEKELVKNYLLFSLDLGNYSFVNLINQNKTVFVITVFIN